FRGGHERGHRALVAHVHGLREHTLGAERAGRLLQRRLAQVAQGHARARDVEGLRDPLADAGARAGDDDDVVLEVEGRHAQGTSPPPTTSSVWPDMNTPPSETGETGCRTRHEATRARFP